MINTIRYLGTDKKARSKVYDITPLGNKVNFVYDCVPRGLVI